MDVQPTISLMRTLGVMALAWTAGCELSVEGAPCPCGPGWVCAEVERDGAGGAIEKQELCVRPYCVFWTYPQRAQGIDVELSDDLLVVSGYAGNVPPGSDILVTGTGTLSTTTGGHRILVEPGGVVSGTGAGNVIYLRAGAIYYTESGTDNAVIHEPGVVFVPAPIDPPAGAVAAIDFTGTVEAPFAPVFHELVGIQFDTERAGFADYVVREGSDVSFPRARANNLFVEERGEVKRIDYSNVVYLQRGARFDANGKRQVIHYVDGARIEAGDDSILIEHTSLELDLCTM
jgi:hypothetical protein